MFAHKLTDDARLRLIEPRHAEELYSLIDLNRERLSPWMTFVEHVTSADSERDFARRGLHQFADGQGFHCNIVYKGKLAGGIGMMPVDVHNRSTEIGYWLDMDAEGKGLVTASCKALLDHVFANMNLNRVVIRTATGNSRSQAVVKRLGGKHEGTQRQAVMVKGSLVDQEVFSVLSEEWPATPVRGCSAFFTHRLDDQTELGILEPPHAEELFALIDDNRDYLRCWLPWVDETKSESDALANRKKHLHEFAENGSLVAGIWYCGALAGTIGLHSIGAKCMEIGYWLGEHYQGKGLVTTACKALAGYAFGEMGMNRLEIRAEPRNDRSRAISERLGLTCEGTLRQKGMNADGEPVDLMMYSLLKDEWEARSDER